MSKRNGSSNTDSSRFAEMYHITTLSPSAISRPWSSVAAVAVRRKWYTGEAQRRISSTAGLSCVSRLSRSAAYCSGCCISAHMPHAVVLRVVSLPATDSSSMNMSNSSSESFSPSTSALMSLVTMSSLRVAVTLLGEVVRVRVQRRRRRVRALGAALELGVVGADHRVRPLEDESAVLLRDAHDLGDRLERELGREVDDEVARAALDHVVDDQRGAVAQVLLEQPDHARREALAHEPAVARVLRRIGVEHHQAAGVERRPAPRGP